jgi:Holliday junction DNA helicase RuvA
MIAYLTGRVVRKGTLYAMLDVDGVGYKLAMTTGALCSLPAEGETARVWTYLHVREDELSLFGFESEAEKDSFEQLIAVGGVGPKVALATLSALSSDALAQAVAAEDVSTISAVPGIGKKTAQRIILDLKDKLEMSGAPLRAADHGTGEGTALTETNGVLLAMGFSASEAAVAVNGYEGESDDAQALLKYALRRLGGGA